MMILFKGLLLILLIQPFETPSQLFQKCINSSNMFELNLTPRCGIQKELHNYGSLEKLKTKYYIEENEIEFGVFIFLSLFIVIFSFNIYYCGSVTYSLYKGKFIQLDR
ncbi:hypothetical protein FQR65_LT00681 [Abscondita terminalis]|nr:hypothetical protein FQR65_LT00681 [Abscondita terminalis]